MSDKKVVYKPQVKETRTDGGKDMQRYTEKKPKKPSKKKK